MVNPYPGKGPTNEPVTLTDLPLLNVIDLTNRSANTRKLKQGQPLDDLESEVMVDTHLCQEDLAIVEEEVNKKRKKKQEAELKHQMISPASSVRSSSALGNNAFG